VVKLATVNAWGRIPAMRGSQFECELTMRWSVDTEQLTVPYQFFMLTSTHEQLFSPVIIRKMHGLRWQKIQRENGHVSTLVCFVFSAVTNSTNHDLSYIPPYKVSSRISHQCDGNPTSYVHKLNKQSVTNSKDNLFIRILW